MGGADEAGPLSVAAVDVLCAPLRGYRTLVLAVSGGGDSTALMHLVHAWNARRRDEAAALIAVTVDHGLRPEAAEEARVVGRQAAGLGIRHRTLRWTGTKPVTGLQATAREARYTLLHEIAIDAGPPGEVAIITGHTSDDQAETFVMRLARGSGVDGLAAMPITGRLARPGENGQSVAVPLVRPFLEVSRARLAATLAACGIGCSDDPSNRDHQFERVRVREALEVLEGLGFGRAALARSARRMQGARLALERATDELTQRTVRTVLGLVAEIDRDLMCAAPEELGIRLLRRTLRQLGGAAEPAMLSSVEGAHRTLCGTQGDRLSFTVGGCIVEIARRGAETRATIRVFREPDRAGGLPSVVLGPGEGALWDERIWAEARAACQEPVMFGPLGADWPRLVAVHPSLSALAIPAAAARGIPVFRRGGDVVAAPLLVAILTAAGDAAGAAALAGPLGPSSGPKSEPLLRAWVVDADSLSEVADP